MENSVSVTNTSTIRGALARGLIVRTQRRPVPLH